jgi:glycosyltransferase involved in cell wall biosynthesis
MMDPLVSVIIPCFNVEDCIEECLESVLDQTYGHLELICVDDGSTDGTRSILEDYASSYELNIILGEHLGASAARNTGLRAAAGQYIQFMDADDLLFPGKIEHQVKLCLEEGSPDLVAGAYIRRLPDGTEMVEEPMGGWVGLVRGRLGCTPSNLWSREMVMRAGGWTETLASSQEVNLLFKMMRLNPSILLDNQPMTTVRERETGSITRQDQLGNSLRFLELRMQMREFLQARKAWNEELEEHFQQMVFSAIKALHQKDQELGREWYWRCIPSDFVPDRCRGTGRSYIWVYRVLGFEWAQRMKNLHERLRGN